MHHDVISASLIGDLERFAIEPPPVGLEAIRASEESETSVMFDLYQQEAVYPLKGDDKNSIVVDLGVTNYIKAIDDYSPTDLVLVGPGFRYPFKRSTIKTEDQRLKCTVLAESFSRCIDENIFHYTKEFMNHSASEVSRLKQLIKNLRDSIENQLTIFIELSAYNFGQSAIALNSYMGLKIFNRTKGSDLFIFKATEIRPGDLLFSSPENQHEVQNMYINLNPKSSYKIFLMLVGDSITIHKIQELKNIYDAEVLTCKLLAKTDNRKNVVIETVEFGVKRTSESYDEVKKSLQHLRC